MALYQAKWGNKGFLVDSTKIVPLIGLSTGFNRKADTNNDTSGTPTTNTRGLELQTINLSTTYLAAAGVDVRAQIDDWKKQFGLHYPLEINGKVFGPKLLELDGVSFTDIQLDNLGRFIRAECSITLVEYVPPTTTVTSKNNAATGTGGGQSSGDSQAGSKHAAMSAKPSTAVKKTMKSGRKTWDEVG